MPAEAATPKTLAEALGRAWAAEGPNVVVLPTPLVMTAPTHLG